MDYLAKGHMIGGFALVAWPAGYRIKTFLVNHRRGVYSGDLSPNTTTMAKQMTTFDPSPAWKPVEGEKAPPVRHVPCQRFPALRAGCEKVYT